MPHESAAAAPKTMGFPGDPFHDPFHGTARPWRAQGFQGSSSVISCTSPADTGTRGPSTRWPVEPVERTEVFVCGAAPLLRQRVLNEGGLIELAPYPPSRDISLGLLDQLPQLGMTQAVQSLRGRSA